MFTVGSSHFPGGSNGKESAHNAGDPGSVSESGRFPGEGNGHPLQYSCLENSIDWGAWHATINGVTKSQTHMSTNTRTHTHNGLLKRTVAGETAGLGLLFLFLSSQCAHKLFNFSRLLFASTLLKKQRSGNPGFLHILPFTVNYFGSLKRKGFTFHPGKTPHPHPISSSPIFSRALFSISEVPPITFAAWLLLNQ